jgi:hypothetical protein
MVCKYCGKTTKGVKVENGIVCHNCKAPFEKAKTIIKKDKESK